jgi:hypothetical protein
LFTQVDKALYESADAYESINDQLIEELPKFLTLVSEYVQLQMFHALQVQTNLYNLVYRNIAPLADILNIDQFSTTQDIPKDFLVKMAVGGSIERIARSITLLGPWCDKVWGKFD